MLRSSPNTMEATITDVMTSVMLRIEARDGPIIFRPWKNVVAASEVLIKEIITTNNHASNIHEMWG